MDIDTAVQERVSCPKLDVPGPTPDQLDMLLAAVARAPDHGLLRPWRFLVVEGDDRQRLGQMVAECCRAEDPRLTDLQYDKLLNAPLRAPTILIVVAEVVLGHKVSVMDQIMACAAGVQNLLLMAHAHGIGAMWRTGVPALSAALKVRLGFRPEDEIVGFIYLGTPVSNGKAPSVADHTACIRVLPDA
jgi:nitroreductase